HHRQHHEDRRQRNRPQRKPPHLAQASNPLPSGNPSANRKGSRSGNRSRSRNRSRTRSRTHFRTVGRRRPPSSLHRRKPLQSCIISGSHDSRFNRRRVRLRAVPRHHPRGFRGQIHHHGPDARHCRNRLFHMGHAAGAGHAAHHKSQHA